MAYYIDDKGRAIPGEKPEEKLDPILGDKLIKNKLAKAKTKVVPKKKMKKKSGLGDTDMIKEAQDNAEYNNPKSFNTLDKIKKRLFGK